MKAGAGSDEFRAQNDTVIRALTAFTRTAQWTPRVAILGAGPGGLNSAYKLQKAGIDTFTIYERQDGVGGVWRQNTYPGAACDVKTHFYSFSWEMKKDWRKPYANQPEILEYLEHVADKYGLRSHLQLNTVITSLEWNEGDATWSITAGDGRVFEADLVISALGLFNEARLPDIPGRANFKGTTFHSWKWNHDHDLTGERVAVIGTGASAVQFVPEIASTIHRLHVFQRQPGWVFPKEDVPFTEEQIRRFEKVPFAARRQRWRIWWAMERGAQIYPGGKMHTTRMEATRDFVRKAVPDPKLQALVMPDYAMGCKRGLPSNEWYPTLQRDNVELVADSIDHFTSNGIVTVDKVERNVDTVIFATGFSTAKYLSSIDVVGRRGVHLRDEWSSGSRAFLGLTITGFPNLFLLYGPNTNGTTSVIHVIEAQVRYIMKVIGRMRRGSFAAVDVKRSTLDRYDAKMQAGLEGSVWAAGCSNYYADEHGKIRTQLPYRFYRYWLMTARVRRRDYRWTPSKAARR
jgi:cyclohexanone monooxygenase